MELWITSEGLGDGPGVQPEQGPPPQIIRVNNQDLEIELQGPPLCRS